MAADDFYRIVGEITIPEDRREELNRNVLRVLDISGVRKTKTVETEGYKATTACRLNTDNKGMVAFDYSIYETVVRDISYYDTKTCRLEINRCGWSDLGLAVMMVLTMIESYSVTPCYVAKRDKLADINFFALIIEDVLGIRLRFPNRADIITMYTFCKENTELRDLDAHEIAKQVPFDFETISGDDVDESIRISVHFYEAIGRDNDNEALGEYGNRELKISDEMKNEITDWRERATEALCEGDDSLVDLETLMMEMEDIGGVRLIDYSLFKDLKSNSDSESTKKAIFLLNNMLFDGIDLFPELTRRQAAEWVLKHSRSSFAIQKMNVLLGLLANREERMNFLNF